MKDCANVGVATFIDQTPSVIDSLAAGRVRPVAVGTSHPASLDVVEVRQELDRIIESMSGAVTAIFHERLTIEHLLTKLLTEVNALTPRRNNVIGLSWHLARRRIGRTFSAPTGPFWHTTRIGANGFRYVKTVKRVTLKLCKLCFQGKVSGTLRRAQREHDRLAGRRNQINETLNRIRRLALRARHYAVRRRALQREDLVRELRTRPMDPPHGVLKTDRTQPLNPRLSRYLTDLERSRLVAQAMLDQMIADLRYLHRRRVQIDSEIDRLMSAVSSRRTLRGSAIRLIWRVDKRPKALTHAQPRGPYWAIVAGKSGAYRYFNFRRITATVCEQSGQEADYRFLKRLDRRLQLRLKERTAINRVLAESQRLLTFTAKNPIPLELPEEFT